MYTNKELLNLDAGTLRGIVSATQLDAKLGAEIQRACKDLPDGYVITISLEKGSGSLVLELPDTDAVIDDFEGFEYFSDQLSAATDCAHSLAALSDADLTTRTMDALQC